MSSPFGSGQDAAPGRPATLSGADARALLSECVRRGMYRVAWVATRSENHDLVLQGAIAKANLGTLLDPATKRVPKAVALLWLEEQLRVGRTRAYRIEGDPSALAYAYTTNNRREVSFLEAQSHRLGMPTSIVNVCDTTPVKGVGLRAEHSQPVVEAARELMSSWSDLAPGLLVQWAKFGTSFQAAMDTLGGRTGGLFVVANDHSPAPVAYASVARFLGFWTCYVQHAEVTDIFPPLDFDLSVLRNQHSLEVYREIGPVAGDVVVAARDNDGWLRMESIRNSQQAVAASRQVTVVIYPSSVFDRDRLGSLVSRLDANSSVREVWVKLHPNSKTDVANMPGLTARLLEAAPVDAHVAICGNSGIVTELLARGNLVFQDFKLDKLVRDYYGFVRDGLAAELVDGLLSHPFWSRMPDSDPESELTLAGYLPLLCTRTNVLASLDLDPAVGKALMAAGGSLERVTEINRMASFHRGLIDLSEGDKKAKPSEGDEWVLDQLHGCPPGVRLLLSRSEAKRHALCHSLEELWLVALQHRSCSAPLSGSIADQVATFARSYRGPRRVRRWVAETAEELLMDAQPVASAARDGRRPTLWRRWFGDENPA